MATTTDSRGNMTAGTDTTTSQTRAANSFQNAREASANAYGSTAETLSGATRKTGETIASNPVIAMAGGFALGALLGVVVPATRREREALQPLGQKLNLAARDSAKQAASASRDKVDEVTGQVMTKIGSAVVDAVAPARE